MEYDVKKVHVFRIPEGSEMLSFINDYAERKGIRMGLVFAIGSLKNPRIGYFIEEEEKYLTISLKGSYELLSAQGNISLKDNKPFAHVHVILGDKEGRAYGGHLIEAEVFVAEVAVVELSGNEPLKRDFTLKGLSLWSEVA